MCAVQYLLYNIAYEACRLYSVSFTIAEMRHATHKKSQALPVSDDSLPVDM